jgi:nucleoside 2-deoxyribosyltransferase
LLKLYLAHPLNKREYIRKLQLRLEGKYNITYINPFYNNQYERQEIENLDNMKFRKDKNVYKQSWDLQTCHNIVDIDLELIRKSDGILAVVEQGIIGTTMEIFYAAYTLRIPVYIIAKDYRFHPWMRSLVKRSGGQIFKNITEYKEFLLKSVGEKK